MYKKTNFWAGIVLAAFLILSPGCSYRETFNGLVGKAKDLLGGNESSQQEEETINENQREIYGKVTAAVGNEITLALGNLKQGDFAFSGDKDNTEKQEGSNRNRQEMENTSKGNRGQSRGGMPEMDGTFEGTQNLPDFSQGEPDFPQGPGGVEKGDFSGGMGTSLELTGEEVSYLVPPSVPVEYAAGGQNLTLSFTRIAKDNLLKVVLQEMDSGEEKIVQIHILG